MSAEPSEIARIRTDAVLFRSLMRDLPYVAMLGMALIGVGLVSFTGQSLTLYWLVLAPIYGAMCIVAGWPKAQDRDQRLRLVSKQCLHWLTFLVAMFLVTSPEVRGVENNNAAGLNLMTILASGCFVAGIHAEAWEICVVGALLALAVPAIAWIEQSAVFFILVAVVLALLIGSILWATHMLRREDRRRISHRSLAARGAYSIKTKI